MSILDEIFAHKRLEVQRQQAEVPLAVVQARAAAAPAALDFIAALQDAPHKPALIAEVKHASPSRGILIADFDPLKLARTYQSNGAAALSVLTDEHYFKGSLDFLSQIAGLKPRLPLLRKDFIFDPYQVYEARAAGADALLLIAAMLEPPQLGELQALARQLGMAALIEVHSLDEIQTVLPYEPSLVGVNNRDLRDFSVSLETSLALRAHIPPDATMVAESGIHTPQDVSRLAQAGVDAILVGEALVTASDIGAAVRSLSGLSKEA